ncbi:putative hemolysin-iii family protein [Zalerion maritima]|uniref:Hemolysin-iii family protein n=1 Tax=Zalerion maritima TaxID=339359 RepID=A0AAD5WLW2_9PEZI|nr:putative hemolysin-iii family protein [Zalerion maritima]
MEYSNVSLKHPFSFTPHQRQDGDGAACSSGAQARGINREAIRRRHSFFIPRRRSLASNWGPFLEGEEGLLLRVDIFLTELERRLDFVEAHTDMSLDTSFSRAYSTLQAVRARCSQVSEEVIGAGRRRLHVMVETLEARYQDALDAADSLNEKARVGLDLLEEMLTDYEDRAYKFREKGFANAEAVAESFLDEGRRVVDEGLELAREVVDEGLRAALSLEEHIERAVERARERGLIRYDDLPDPWRINKHIQKGYRFCESKAECVWSAFGISNESVNIWTHMVGFVLVMSIAFYFYPTSINFHLSSKADVLVAAVFFFAACQCLACSTIWHTMNAVADVDMISIFACVDYTGISLLIAASIMTTEYTAFYCEPVSRWLYMVTTAVLGIGGVILPWHPKFNGQHMAWARVAFFVGLGATGFLPMLQISLSRGPGWVWEFYAPIGKSLFVYLAGAFVYASKIPERWWPGVFDYVGGSHNLWHMAVLGGILFHYSAMQQFFANAFRQAQGGCPAY